MVLIYSKQGQLANRLWQASYFISNAIENNYSLLHLGFSDYLEYFDENISIQFKKMGIRCRMIDYKSTALKDRLIISYSNLARSFNKRKNIHFPFVVEIRLDSLQQYDISNKSFSKIAERNILLTDGFIFIDKDALNTHQETIRKIFKPNKVFIKKIENLKQNFFSKYEKIVGVHIRKGDYLTFLNGRWNYSNQDYLSFMKQILLLPSLSNKKVAFLLCSNEDIEIKDFEGVTIIYSMKHFIEDLYALASCDLIIGPPSTFSSWASFYGKVPLFQIEDKVTKINEECFQIRENI